MFDRAGCEILVTGRSAGHEWGGNHHRTRRRTGRCRASAAVQAVPDDAGARGGVADVVRQHRQAVLCSCTERLWPDADAAVDAAAGVLVAARRPWPILRSRRVRTACVIGCLALPPRRVRCPGSPPGSTTLTGRRAPASRSAVQKHWTRPRGWHRCGSGWSASWPRCQNPVSGCTTCSWPGAWTTERGPGTRDDRCRGSAAAAREPAGHPPRLRGHRPRCRGSGRAPRQHRGSRVLGSARDPG